jgi:hypothetical protein
LPPTCCSRFASFPSKPPPPIMHASASLMCGIAEFVWLQTVDDSLLLGKFSRQPRGYVLTMIDLFPCIRLS